MCWFSGDSYPVEIKACLKTWKKILPDYQVKLWTMQDARDLNIDFINGALDERRWAFASDVVRFFAVYKYGGVYMDSDIYLKRRFDEFLPDKEDFCTFHEKIYPEHEGFGLQAAFFMGKPGNAFCKEMVDYYSSIPYRNEDGTVNELISPFVMRKLAVNHGYVSEDRELHLDCMTVYPTHFIAPRKRYDVDSETVGIHRVYGNWRKRKFGRRMEIAFNHVVNVIKYYVFGI